MVWGVLGFLALLGWSIAGGIVLEPRLWRWIARKARRSTGRAALLAAGVQFGGLLVFGLLALVGVIVAQAAGDSRFAAVGVVPGCVVYAPVLMLAMPSKYRGYEDTRKEMRSAGATRSQARAAAWAGAPFALLGASLVMSALFATFAS